MEELLGSVTQSGHGQARSQDADCSWWEASPDTLEAAMAPHLPDKLGAATNWCAKGSVPLKGKSSRSVLLWQDTFQGDNQSLQDSEGPQSAGTRASAYSKCHSTFQSYCQACARVRTKLASCASIPYGCCMICKYITTWEQTHTGDQAEL